MNGKSIEIAAIQLAEKLPDLLFFEKIPLSMKMFQLITAPPLPSGRDRGPEGNEAFPIPAFSQIQAPFFQLGAEQ